MTLAEIREAVLAAYEVIESVAWDDPVFEDEKVDPAHAKLESLLYGDDALPADGVIVPVNVWPWPGGTRLPWQVWNEVPHPDGMTIYDPDGFRGDKATVVTWAEFDRARGECTLVSRMDR